MTRDLVLIIPMTLVVAVGSYVTYFVIGELPKKIGYLKFFLVCLAYVLLIGLMVPVAYINLNP